MTVETNYFNLHVKNSSVKLKFCRSQRNGRINKGDLSIGKPIASEVSLVPCY